MEVPSPAGLGVGDVNFSHTRLLCDGCPPLGWDVWGEKVRSLHGLKRLPEAPDILTSDLNLSNTVHLSNSACGAIKVSNHSLSPQLFIKLLIC